MRIVGGHSKGRRLRVQKKGIRPTKAIVREAIFNIINALVVKADVLDIFAGSGALGLEALSRGARSCTFIEKNINTLCQNIKTLTLQEKATVIRSDYRSGLKRVKMTRFDIIFIDPPYHTHYIDKALALISDYSMMKQHAVVVAEHSIDETVIIPETLIVFKTKKYGDTALSFLEHAHA